MMDFNTEIIGVDVGNGLVKTVHTEFISSIKDYGETKPALKDKVLRYNNKYYIVGGERSKTKTDQKNDETALILCLAGIAEELRFRGKTTSHIVLSEGLPLERCIKQNKDFDKEYYLEGKKVAFEYEDVLYTIFIDRVIVNPQCVSGIVNLQSEKKLPNYCAVIDIGSWTVDILPIINGRPDQAAVLSLPNGVINCYLDCNSEIRRRTGKEVREEQIMEVMKGNKDVLPEKRVEIIVDTIDKYIKDLADTISEHKFDSETLDFIFMGGGTSLIQNYGMKYFPNAKFIPDIRANAKGYEVLARHVIEKKNSKVS